MSDLLDTPVTTLLGEDTTLRGLAGGAALVVDVASRCGVTFPITTQPDAPEVRHAIEEVPAR